MRKTALSIEPCCSHRLRLFANSTFLTIGVLLLVGCHAYRPGHGNLMDKGPEPVQQLLQERLTQQRQAQTGPQRWQSFQENPYQSSEDISRSRERLGKERRREQMAEELMSLGPLDLVDCIAFSLEFNDTAAAARAEIDALGGDELIVRSRFLPQVFFDLDHESRQRKAKADSVSQTDPFFRWSQTLLEFGKDNVEDVALRQLQRDALFNYEDIAADVISQVRLKFFTILLRRQQLLQRRELLDEFSRQYQRILRKYDKKLAVEIDVLTAHLNVLNEQSRINLLNQEILRQKIDLLHLIGFPPGMTDFQLQGDIELLQLSLESAVDVALKNSTRIAQARAVVAEQRRVARQVLWEYGPDVDLQAGWKNRTNAAGVELLGENGFYALAPFAEHHLKSQDEGFAAGQDVLQEDEFGWFLGMSVELPIFTGLERTGRRLKERALLRAAQHELRDTVDVVELEIRKTYQTMLEIREELSILEQTVEISKKRLKAKERLKELNRISDDELETFRDRFFHDQDAYFAKQIEHIASQEEIRSLMRYFPPQPAW